MPRALICMPAATICNEPRKGRTLPMTFRFPFENTYARLPDRFYVRVAPTPVRAPRLVRLNTELALDLGLDPAWLAGPEGLEVLAGQRVPFSRRGDGRAALGPVLREFVVSEAMAALGIPTTRSLAAVVTGETVARETLLPGAVLTRIAMSHIRVGTFQFFAARGDLDGLRLLADHVISRHYPEAARADRPYRALLEFVTVRQAELIARWLLVGFIHGVMNTDNMSVAGETIDYRGRYAYANQPQIATWNLARFAETLLPLIDDDQHKAIAQAEELLDRFPACFEAAYSAGLRQKLGLAMSQDGDLELAGAFLGLLAANQVDFTLAFRRLSEATGDAASGAPLRSLFQNGPAFDSWLAPWRERLAREPGAAETRRARMRAVNPAFTPRNHRIEAMIQAAVERDDYSLFEELLAVVARPFDDQADFARYMEPPQPHERVCQTFCGT